MRAGDADESGQHTPVTESRGGHGDAPAYIRLSGVSKSYGSGRTRVEALSGVDLEVRAGEFVIVTGPPGSGKTTLIELVGAMQRPTAGEIVVGGRRLDLLDDRGRLEFRTQNIALAPQRPTLAPTLSVYETVWQVARLRGIADSGSWTREVLDAVGLLEDDLPAAELSTEEQQRLSVARALVKDAPLFLADEPLSAASPDARRGLAATLRRLAREGRTILLVDADTPTADRLVRL